MPHLHRRLLIALTGLATLAVAGLTAREADAAWNCGVLDGPNSTQQGAMNGSFWPSSAVLLNGDPVLLYGGRDPAWSTSYVRYAQWVPNKLHVGHWILNTLESSAWGTLSPPGALGGSSIWTAYGKDTTNSFLALGEGTTAPGTSWDFQMGTQQGDNLYSPPQIVSYNGNTYVIYWYEGPDGSNLAWRQVAPNLLSENVITPLQTWTPNPVAVVWGGKLQVFYQTGSLSNPSIEWMTFDGYSWTPQGAQYLGPGSSPAVIVDSASTLHVFYADNTNVLHEARFSASPGPVQFYTVDSGVPMAPVAPAILNGTLQVYYPYFTTGPGTMLRGASLVNGSWTNQTIIDGAAGSGCGSQGTTDSVGGAITALTSGSYPTVFYSDDTTGDLRVAAAY